MLALASRKLNGILADEMGLGKTLQTVSVLGVTTLDLLDRKPHLVIVPLSVLGNWQREFAKWCPALKVTLTRTRTLTLTLAVPSPSPERSF